MSFRNYTKFIQIDCAISDKRGYQQGSGMTFSRGSPGGGFGPRAQWGIRGVDFGTQN